MPKLSEIALIKVYCDSCGQFLGSVIKNGFIKCDSCKKYTQAKFTPKVSGKIKTAVIST